MENFFPRAIHAFALIAIGLAFPSGRALAEPDASTLKAVGMPKPTESITPRERALAYRKQLSRMARGLPLDPDYFRKLEILFGDQVYYVPLPTEINFPYCEQADEESVNFEFKCLTHVGTLSLSFLPWEGSIMEMIGKSADEDPKPGAEPKSRWKCVYLAHSNSSLLRKASECTAIETDAAKNWTSFRAWIQPLEAKYTMRIRLDGETKYAEARRQLAGAVAYGTAVFTAGGTPAEEPTPDLRRWDEERMARAEARKMNLGRQLASATPRLNDVAEQGALLDDSFQTYMSDGTLPKKIDIGGRKYELRENKVMKGAIVYAEYAPADEQSEKFWEKRLFIRFWKNSLLSLTDYAHEVAASTEARMTKDNPIDDFSLTKSKDGKSVFLNLQYADKEMNARFVEHSVYRAFRMPNGLVSYQWAERHYPRETLRGEQALKEFLQERQKREPRVRAALASGKLPLPKLALEGAERSLASDLTKPDTKQ